MTPEESETTNFLSLGESGSRPAPNPRWPYLEQSFERTAVSADAMDNFWGSGWRHFGIHFFRYSLAIHEGQVVAVIPLRIDLNRWQSSPSQRRVVRRNQDLEVTFIRPQIDAEHRQLFLRHIHRFRTNVPERLENFLGNDPGRTQNPASYPCDCVEVCVRKAGALIAASYLDVGREAVSSVYAMFDPSESRRSLGVATFLWEIDFARERRCRFLYPGYVYAEPSPYDYKKRLGALEAFDWRSWRPWISAPKS